MKRKATEQENIFDYYISDGVIYNIKKDMETDIRVKLQVEDQQSKAAGPQNEMS